MKKLIKNILYGIAFIPVVCMLFIIGIFAWTWDKMFDKDNM